MRLAVVRTWFSSPLAVAVLLAGGLAAPREAHAQESCRCEVDALADTTEAARLARVPTTRWAPSGSGRLPLEFVLPGMRVRLDAPGFVHSAAAIGHREGVILAIRGDTLLFDGAMHRELVLVPVSKIVRLDVSTGRGPTQRNTVIGAIIGTSAGVLTAALINISGRQGEMSSCSPGPLPGCPRDHTVLLVGGAVGGGIGALVGHFIPQHRWRPVALR